MYVSAKVAPILALTMSGIGACVASRIFWKTQYYLTTRIIKVSSPALISLMEEFNAYRKEINSSSEDIEISFRAYHPRLYNMACPHNTKQLENLDSSKPFCSQGQQTCYDHQAKILEKYNPLYGRLEMLQSIKEIWGLVTLIIGKDCVV